jgi:hypothetical protein
MGRTAGLDVLQKTEITSTWRDTNPGPSSPQPIHLYRLRQNLTQNYTSSGPDMNQLRHVHNTTLLKKTPINEYCAVQYTKPKTTPLH